MPQGSEDHPPDRQFIEPPLGAPNEVSLEHIPGHTAVSSPLAIPDPTLPLEARGPKRWSVGTLSYSALGLASLFAWLLWGDFAFSVKERSVVDVIVLMLNQSHARDVTISFLTQVLPQVITLVLFPIISYKSDRHRGRWGRRRPFLLIPLPVATVALMAVGSAPRIAASLATPGHPRDLLTTCLIGSSWTIFEVSALTANCIFTAFVADVVPRALLGRFYALFRAVSLLAGIVFNQWFLGIAEYHYLAVFSGVALLYGVGMALMCLNVREGEYPPPPPPPQALRPTGFITRPMFGVLDAVSGGAGTRVAGTMRTYLVESFADPFYVWIFAAMGIAYSGIQIINTFNAKFAKSLFIPIGSEGIFSLSYGHEKALTYVFSLAQAYPIGWLVDRFHPVRMAIIALALHAIACLYGGLFMAGNVTFAIGFVACGVLSGTFFTSTAALAAKMLPKDRFAQFNASLEIVKSLGIASTTLIAGFILDHTGHPYRHTYSAGVGFDLAAIAAFTIVWRMHRTRERPASPATV